MAKPKIFIDGDQGTTGLEIRQRLSARDDIEFVRLPDEFRKDVSARAEALNSADVAILCLPDDAAREAVSLIENSHTRVIDASSAHRISSDWTYGFPEFLPEQADKIANAKRVSNPGCYPTGAVALIRPLVDAGLVPAHFPMTVNAISGYSGGGKNKIGQFEHFERPDFTSNPYEAYGLTLEHKHTEEMRVHMGLERQPLFSPSVGKYYKGMLVFVPLQLWAMETAPTSGQIIEVLAERYMDARYVYFKRLNDADEIKVLAPEACNGTNDMNLYAFANDAKGQILLVAQLDNLGKGASGAAVQSLDLMLGN